MKQIEVEIMQQSYVLGCPDGQEARLLEAVERVDSAMTGIRDAGKVRSRERIAVLAALNMAFDLADKDALLQAAAQAQPLTPAAATDADVAEQAAIFSDAYAEILQGLVQRLDEGLGKPPQQQAEQI